jgi:rubrerythrin
MKLDSVEAILQFAMQQEQQAHDLYMGLARQAKTPNMKATFEAFAQEEAGHKAKLQAVQDGRQLLSAERKILDLRIGDHLEAVEASTDLDYQDALILAMKAEKNAYRMYHSLAQATDDAATKELLLGLAQEEAQHKLRFEIEYDDVVLAHN